MGTPPDFRRGFDASLAKALQASRKVIATDWRRIIPEDAPVVLAVAGEELRVNKGGSEKSRIALLEAQLATERYAVANMMDLPDAYRQSMPHTTKIRELRQAEKSIRARFKLDFQMIAFAR
jgi:hypothetical protein